MAKEVMVQIKLQCPGGQATPGREPVGKVTRAQVREIAKMKMKDLNAGSEEAAMRIIEGTARSCGIAVEA